MLGYVTIGARDVEASGKFYDAVLGKIGDERKFAEGGWIGYGPKTEGIESQYCYLCTPFDQQPARAGNGIMLAFVAHSKDAVNAAHAAGLANGGTDEGTPGPRPADSVHFYGAYLRDPTGNKICVYFKS
jgi:catechol 2,3-dioxygenase-like lactoylglutathione lyase family enzyme